MGVISAFIFFGVLLLCHEFVSLCRYVIYQVLVREFSISNHKRFSGKSPLLLFFLPNLMKDVCFIFSIVRSNYIIMSIKLYLFCYLSFALSNSHLTSQFPIQLYVVVSNLMIMILWWFFKFFFILTVFPITCWNYSNDQIFQHMLMYARWYISYYIYVYETKILMMIL